MITVIARKEILESRRDRRVLLVLALIGLLAIGSLVTGWSTHTEHEHQVQTAQRDDQTTFVRQGAKSPHSAAHFGLMAYKPSPPLAVFDPGASAYLGQVVWLEAHRRSPAMFRSAEDAPELRRLADLSAAGVLTLLLPLLMILGGHGAFAAEREAGTLRQVMSAGLALRTFFSGKLMALAALSLGVCVVTIGMSTTLALANAEASSRWDIIGRSVGLVLGYLAYAVSFAAVTLLVSASVRTARSALFILLTLWATSVILIPRIAATVAERVYPTPDSNAFWRHSSDAIRVARHTRDTLAYRDAERAVLSEALGRDISASEVASLEVNTAGLRLAVSEQLDAAVYAEVYRDLYATYEKQKRVRRLLSTLSPTIALHHFSTALSGTDVSAHQHFALKAERHRNLITSTMNQDMMLNGVGQNDRYIAGEALWSRVPELRYEAPRASFAIRSGGWDLVILLLWTAAATWFARHRSLRQSVL